MSNKKVLESLEQNIEGVEQLVYFTKNITALKQGESVLRT